VRDGSKREITLIPQSKRGEKRRKKEQDPIGSVQVGEVWAQSPIFLKLHIHVLPELLFKAYQVPRLKDEMIK